MFLRNNKYFLLVCPVYEPYESGGAQSFPLIVKALSKKYNPIVLTEYHNKKKLFEKKQNVFILRIIPIRDNFGKKTFIYSLYSFVLGYLLIYLVSIPLALLGLRIFHFTRYCSYIISPLLIFLRLLNVRIIYDCRTELNNDQIKEFTFIFKFCSYLLANSEAAFNSLVKNTSTKIPKKLLINPLKIEKIYLTKNFKVGKKIIIKNENIVCIGTVSERKSSLKIAKAFLEAINQISNNLKINQQELPKLLFVGRNDLGKNFISFIADYENINYLGPTSHLNSLKLIKSSFGSISASLSEGIPRSCLESIFLGKPSLVPACVPEFSKYCPEVCVSTRNQEDFHNLIGLIKSMIIDRSYILEMTKNYPIKKHNYLFFESELLNFYNVIYLDTNK